MDYGEMAILSKNFEQVKSIQGFETDNLNCRGILSPPTLRG